GGCALIPGIDVELYQRLGIETKILDPFENIEIAEQKFDVDAMHKIGPMMVVPVGLALRSFDQ
ncbi:MAG: pilus assembly protein PilM, partial [Ghiorsea sp.]